ncbi:hypothetical protein V8G54_019617 [Vigna mungo]|uniref:Uncharacterized protein n=1 Tax=Vigna mungo TaxID=3915 RepID=A0AAQ3RVX3_VIGMU
MALSLADVVARGHADVVARGHADMCNSTPPHTPYSLKDKRMSMEVDQQAHSIGTTLSKGLNRGLGTLPAASLAFLTEYIVDAPGRIFRAVFIAIAVFIIEDRITTIAIGCAICLVMSILVFPNWSGEDLHNNTILRLEGLANCIKVRVREYFNDSEESTCQDDSSEDPIYKGYKAFLDSKTTDETLVIQCLFPPM